MTVSWWKGRGFCLRTKDEAEARTLLNAKNESFRQTEGSLAVADTKTDTKRVKKGIVG